MTQHHQRQQQQQQQQQPQVVPWVAVSHVRDQILAPHLRKDKNHLWVKAVKYVREQESRVREDVQRIYGEEHRVWSWIPDIQWGTPQGPNPFPIRLQQPISPPPQVVHTPVAHHPHPQPQPTAYRTTPANSHSVRSCLS